MKKIRHTIRLLLLAAVLLIAAFSVSHRWTSPAKGDHTLRVMTWNTFRMDQGATVDRNRVLQYLHRHPVDVVCLEEAEVSKQSSGLNLEEIKSYLSDIYPYSYVDFKLYQGRYRRYGLMVFSRYPLIHKESIHYESAGNSSARCDVVVGGDTLRLLVNHLESNRLVQSDWADSLSTDEIRRKSEQIGGKLRRAGSVRWVQAGVVRDEVNRSPYPVIAAGDFNSLPLSRVCLRLRFGALPFSHSQSPSHTLSPSHSLPWLRDTFLEGSRGRLGGTIFYHHIPLRIDYILCSRSLRVLSSEVDYSATGSDHYPLTTTLTW